MLKKSLNYFESRRPNFGAFPFCGILSSFEEKSPNSLTVCQVLFMTLIMSQPCRNAMKCLTRVSKLQRPSISRNTGAALHRHATSRRWQSTEAEATSNPKIVGIVDQISQLTLLETADLISSLKVCLKGPYRLDLR